MIDGTNTWVVVIVQLREVKMLEDEYNNSENNEIEWCFSPKIKL